LKRLDDARCNGDHVHAVIRDITTLTDDRAREIGESGATTGLAAVVKSIIGLNDRIVPASVDGPSVRPAQFWLRNRIEGPRRETIEVTSLGAKTCRVLLEEAPCSDHSTARRTRLAPPAGLRRSGLFALEGRDDRAILERIRELEELGRESSSGSIDALARRWWRLHPSDPDLPRGLAIVADGLDPLRDLLAVAERFVIDTQGHSHESAGGSIHLPRDGMPRGVAFVYPGLGSYFAGMGRELSLLWPDVLSRQDAENRSLRDQLAPEVWWNGELPQSFADHREPILGQVAIGSLVTDILVDLGVAPDAAIGYSMGESAALVALRAWPDRDELTARLRSSPLFATELAGPCLAARRAWGLPPDQPVPWIAGIVPRSAEDVEAAIAATGKGRVYVLIRNTSDETVIGGERSAVQTLVRTLRCALLELPVVSTVHCAIGRLVESEYRALHDIETLAPPRIAFYSGVSSRRYSVDRRSAVEAIAAQASQPIDFSKTIERAYADGIGLFIEVGPGSPCTRLIGRILGDRPHIVRSACRPDRDAFGAVLEVLADRIAHRLPVDLASLYGSDEVRPSDAGLRPQATVRVDVGPADFRVPPLPSRPRHLAVTMVATTPLDGEELTSLTPALAPQETAPIMPASGLRDLAGSLHDAERARLEAHRAFLRVAQGAADLIGRQLALQIELLESGRSIEVHRAAEGNGRYSAAPVHTFPLPISNEPILYDRRQCMELAVGSVAAVFGPEFAEVDQFPTRVRLPDEPLMLVDRIMALEGSPRALDRGRIVTEHDIQPGAWYLDGDRVAPCIAMEAGQADLVLSGYLGVDFLTQGQSVYRLLDANVTFHRGLPVVGDVMRYDIRITKFFRQGSTILFRFEYDATVRGEPLITMRDGCAGFFTAEELAAGKGIVPGGLESRMRPAPAIDRMDDLIPISSTRLEEAAVEALRQGDLTTAFDTPFDGLDLSEPIALPGGLMAMIRRVTALDPSGGPAGLGLIRAEADIEPGDWYMVCHFVDDRVMPGTLMYECCLHTLRIFLMRLGWVGRRDRVAFEPVPGVANRLKCRGQITEATRRVTYEVTIKERGYRPEPYAIADALIVADGKPIVSVTDLALQLSGTRREELERLWSGCPNVERSISGTGCS
jgi:malonyl CoA-acyl carrier protein transacylase/3-hydroxymyristoyl/3-hydroxydecanoyl-(acyl carrier protein) dehydratase